MSFKIPKPSLSRNSTNNSNDGSSTTLPRAPTSLLAGALPPSLVSNNPNEEQAHVIPSRPRRLWTIEDTSLKSIPKHYPPMNRQTTTYVGDASPSVVAVRISECFRKRSIAVEYDDESVSTSLIIGCVWDFILDAFVLTHFLLLYLLLIYRLQLQP